MAAILDDSVMAYYYGFVSDSQPRSVIFRAKVNGAGASGFCFGRSYGNQGDIIGFSLDDNGGHPRIKCTNSGATQYTGSDTGQLANGVWKSFGITHPGGAGGACKLYDNSGNLITTITEDSTGGSDEFFMFGNNLGGGHLPAGTLIGKLKLFTAVLSDSQMKNEILYHAVQNPSDCFGVYNFPDDGSGNALPNDPFANHNLSYLGGTLLYSSDEMSLPENPPVGSPLGFFCQG